MLKGLGLLVSLALYTAFLLAQKSPCGYHLCSIARAFGLHDVLLDPSADSDGRVDILDSLPQPVPSWQRVGSYRLPQREGASGFREESEPPVHRFRRIKRSLIMALLEQHMKIAIEEARLSLRDGNFGFGAVMVRDEEVLARAHDSEETDADPTAHAELAAIRSASRLTGKDLSSCTLVSTHEPCPMCSAAIAWARIPRVAFGYGIVEAIAQGRRRMAASCEEIFQRVGAKVAVERGILKEECAILYNDEVRRELKRLRLATDEQLQAYDRERAVRRIEWYQAQQWPSQMDDSLELAYQVLLRKLGIHPDQAPVVHKDAKTLVFHSMNFCPTLEACKILELDTRRVCKLHNEISPAALVKEVDSRLVFSRNYDRIRPHSEYCEEQITCHVRDDVECPKGTPSDALA